MTTTKRTLAEGLKRFNLIDGPGGEEDDTACAMTLLAWVDGCDKWTDHPPCAHPTVANLVTAANDLPSTTPAMRARLAKLGMKGVLDTWWVPGVVIAAAQRLDADAEVPDSYERAVQVLKFLANWKKTRPLVDLTYANLTGANLTDANLIGANLTYANLADAYGNPRSRMPKGWKLDKNGRWERA